MEAEKNPNIEKLLNNIFYSKSNLMEKKQLYDLFADSDNEKIIKEILYNHLEECKENIDFKHVDFDLLYKNILHNIKHNESIEIERLRYARKARLRRIIIYTTGVAALFVVAFFLGTLFSRFDIINSSEAFSAQTFNEIKAPLGSKTEIKLPDGTSVILNAGSTLRYRSDFNMNNRDLDLIGEGYFKVAKNNLLPLNVSAGDIIIKAIGTEFNIKAYDEEEVIETTLVEGKIQITQSGQNENDNQALDLNPNQKAIYIKESDSFALEEVVTVDSSNFNPVPNIYQNILISPKVDISEIVAWTQGKLIIRGQRLDDLCVDLQRKYNVSFLFRDEEIKGFRFTGVLLDETLEQVLDVIKLTAPIGYSLEGKTVYLSSDKEKLNNYLDHMK